jgi:hypothetical protein
MENLPNIEGLEVWVQRNQEQNEMITKSVDMRLVYLESPYAGFVDTNKAYLKDCMLDSLARGEAPFASHEMYTRVLVDELPEERKAGMEAGFAWAANADVTVVYYDLGISGGMREGISRAARAGRPIEWRSLPKWAKPSFAKDYVEPK